ncbi:hypothetical protein VTJ83DRAFT_1464 [Remersonia thermophila]|uniref:BZIP domain-containing protein n=1 Tax=Remersonia thermophila TaxID=72144 RepID=A0ABR4DGI2_9PEZI
MCIHNDSSRHLVDRFLLFISQLRGRPYIVQEEWTQQETQSQCVASASLSLPSIPSDGLFHNSLLLDGYHDLGPLIDNFTSDSAANPLDPTDPVSTFPNEHDLSSLATPALADFDFACTDLDPFTIPVLNGFAPFPGSSSSSSPSVPSLTNTPTTAPLHSPSPDPPSSIDKSLLYPGLKLPPAKPPSTSRPGRRPARASLSRTAGGRVTKPSSGITPTANPTVIAAAAEEEDVDPEVLDRRYRNNLAAKRYRQKKIDRIQELEAEVQRVTEERDDLRIRLARQEAEVAALRAILKLKIGGGGDAAEKD